MTILKSVFPELQFKPYFFLLAFCFISRISFSGNPIIADLGVSDPHIRVFNDTVFLYSGHDSDPDDRTWVMKDWRVFSSTDLVDWKLEASISPKDNYMDDNSSDCWASDAATRNGKYYFYFSDRKRGIGVMTSNSPKGPFVDPLGKPLVSPLHDPTIFSDDDRNKTCYIVYGDKTEAYYVAKLNEDMVSVAEKPRPIQIVGEAWQNAPEWMDKNYLFKYNGTYYLSWGCDYAVSKNIYGPYECAGAVGLGQHLNEYAHGSFFWWKGQFYHIWCYYLRDGYKYRESVISYCHFDDHGAIVTDTGFLDEHFTNGVGQYDSSWPKIEVEWFYEISSGVKKQGTRKDGFVLTDIKDGSWIKFANVDFHDGKEKFEGSIACTDGKGTIEIRVDSLSGLVLGTVPVDASGKSSVFRDVSCKIANVNGKRDLYLNFTGDKKCRLKIDYFRFAD